MCVDRGGTSRRFVGRGCSQAFFPLLLGFVVSSRECVVRPGPLFFSPFRTFFRGLSYAFIGMWAPCDSRVVGRRSGDHLVRMFSNSE